MATIEERVSFIEGKLDQFATKSDIAILKSDLTALELRLTLRLGGLMVVGFGAVIAALRFWQ